jgi:hypothetical protein
VTFRNYYLDRHKKNIYDETNFQGFVLDCMGETILPDREKRLLGEARKKAGKPYNYKYDPSVSKPPNKYTFANSSGNQIIKDSQLKLKKENLSKNFLNDYEESESENETEEIKELQTSEITTDAIDTSEQINSLDTTETSDETDISK